MAKTNKYTSINFNHVLEKNHPASGTAASNAGHTTKQPSSSYSSIASPNGHLNGARTHGRMLVLTKPTPKPIFVAPPLSPSQTSKPIFIAPPLSPSQTPSPQIQQPQPQVTDPSRTEAVSDQISLRPLGRTRSGSENFAPAMGQGREKEAGSIVVGSAKLGKFVPPHLRPGFEGREEKPGPEVFRAREMGQKHFGSPGRYGEDERPKSGGHERTRRGVDLDLGFMSRPRSSGNRPSSSGS